MTVAGNREGAAQECVGRGLCLLVCLKSSERNRREFRTALTEGLRTGTLRC